MPIVPGGRRGGGGSGFALGPRQNEFANAAARDAYANANAAWLALYNADRGNWIRVVDVAQIQRRNAAGTGWEDVSGVIEGRRGPIGPQGPAQSIQTIVNGIDALLGSNQWRSRLSGAGLIAAIDAATGGQVWRAAPTVLRNAQQTIALLDAALGSQDWRTGGVDPTAVNQLIQAALEAAVEGNTETGITVTYRGGKLDFVVGQVGPVSHPDAYIAWSTDAAFSAAEFKAGTGIMGAREGIIPAVASGESFDYLGLWLEGTHWDAVRSLTMNHGVNLLSTLEAAVDLTIDGVAGKYRRFTDQQGDRAVGMVLRWST